MEILYVDESWYYLILINLSHDCTKSVLKVNEALTKNKQPLMKWSILLVSLPLEDIFRVLIVLNVVSTEQDYINSPLELFRSV